MSKWALLISFRQNCSRCNWTQTKPLTIVCILIHSISHGAFLCHEIILVTFSKIFDVFTKCILLHTMCSTPFHCRMRMRCHGTRLGVPGVGFCRGLYTWNNYSILVLFAYFCTTIPTYSFILGNTLMIFMLVILLISFCFLTEEVDRLYLWSA